MSRKIYRQNLQKVWVEPKADGQYVAGADVGGGGPQSQSASCAYIADTHTGEFVAVLYGWWDYGGFADRLHSLVADYNRAFLAVENNMGYAVLMRLMDHYAYENLYFYREPLARAGHQQATPGFNVNSVTRRLILDNLAVALRDRGITIYDAEFFAEAATFQWTQKAGSRARPEALRGKLDDRVMAAAITVQMLQERPHVVPPESKGPKTIDAWHHRRQFASAMLRETAKDAGQTGDDGALFVTGASKHDKWRKVFEDEEHEWLDELEPFLG